MHGFLGTPEEGGGGGGRGRYTGARVEPTLERTGSFVFPLSLDRRALLGETGTEEIRESCYDGSWDIGDQGVQL